MKNKNLYPDNWVDEIRPQILKRDNYKCKECNQKHRQCIVIISNNIQYHINKSEIQEWKNQNYKAYQIFLQVHHIDGNKNNNIDSNLISLCPNCHRKADASLNKIKRISKSIK
tara:strand:+ start:1243 stop:1581 length:339 start_codon:yes stop_codon:yes gene_type:complete